jgi:hypothetical protein
VSGAPYQPSPNWEPGAPVPEPAPGPGGQGWGPPPGGPGSPGTPYEPGSPVPPFGTGGAAAPVEPTAAHEGGKRAVAILLATAAVLAAIIAAQASFLSSSASGDWQSALRTEVKRSAGALEDIRYLYQTELPMAVQILQARALQAELQAAGSGATSAVQQALAIEAQVQADLLAAMEPTSDIATKSQYALASGGLDLGKRLADIRAQAPDIVALDPDSLQATGDSLANKARLLTLAALPIAVAALLGVLAEPFRRRRRILLAGGTIALAVGATMAIAVQVLA